MSTSRAIPRHRPRRLLLLGATAASALAFGAYDDDDPVVPDQPTVAELAAESPRLGTLTAALDAAGLVSTLQGPGPFTVFAPVDEAFAALGTERIERLLAEGNEALLAKVLTYHVVPGEILSSDLSDGARVATVQGDSLTFDLGDGARVNGARIVSADIRGSNGVVHLVDGVLTGNLDLVDVAVIEGFGSLVGAVRAAGLEETLRTDNGGQGFTVFAPTDAAFAGVGEVPSDADALSAILLYHAVGGTVLSTDLSDGQAVTSLEGGTLTVDLGTGVTLLGSNNQARVVVTDVRAANGVIHAIDAVLLP